MKGWINVPRLKNEDNAEPIQTPITLTTRLHHALSRQGDSYIVLCISVYPSMINTKDWITNRKEINKSKRKERGGESSIKNNYQPVKQNSMLYDCGSDCNVVTRKCYRDQYVCKYLEFWFIFKRSGCVHSYIHSWIFLQHINGTSRI